MQRPPAARVWPRFASLSYEAVLLVPILFVAGYLFLALTREAGTPLMRALFQLWVLGWVGAYLVYCWVRGGQTLAMKAWRLRVETVDGRPLGLRCALLRYVVALAGLLTFGTGFLWALVDRDKQCLHDRIAGTRVVSMC